MKSPLIFRIFKNNQLVGVKQFDQEQIVIGNKAEVNLDLDSDQVSPIHCLIELRDNGYYICDLGSQSGTFKNGQAILDEMISSGDEIGIGPFKIAFFVGVPKPKAPPNAGVIAETVMINVFENKRSEYIEKAPMPPPTVVKKEEIVVATETPVLPEVLSHSVQSTEIPRSEEKPQIVAAPVRPDIRGEKAAFKKQKKSKTFAPPSEIKSLKSYLKPGKGAQVEVIVAWKERVLTTYHFKGKQTIRVNVGGDNQVALPDGILPRGFPLLELSNGLRVNTTAEMTVELVSSAGSHSLDEMAANGKSQRGSLGYGTRVDQDEMLCVGLPGGNLYLYIRFVPQAATVPMLPFMLSGTEITGVVMSVVLVGLLALYISATTPKDWQETKQEDVQRIAQVIFKRPMPAEKPPVVPEEVKAPVPVPTPKPTPTPTPTPDARKVVVADQSREAQMKGTSTPNKAVAAQKAGQAQEVAPKPNAQDRTKKFTSTRQGGAVKMGETAGANAASEKKDLSKVGLFGSFGGGGSRANIDKAYSGAGEILGMADKATGTSGFNENRAGTDLGSKFKDSGAGGKGTATQGIRDIGTKGRSSGESAYGSADGFGRKTTVAIEGGGFEESFDGTIDKEAIRRVIRAKLSEVRSCYERALNVMEKGRRLEGKIVLGWEIIEKGQTRNVKVKSSTLGNAQVENCIRDRLASWTFPEPPPGLVAEVQAYPFVLNQAN